MTNIFEVSADIKQDEERDVIAGQKLATGIYPMKLKLVYLDQSKGGAHNVNIVGEINGLPYNETIYLTNRAGNNFYLDKKTGDKRLMPGFSQVSNMCELLAGKKLGAMAMETKLIKVYDYTEKTEVPVERKVLTELLGMLTYPAIYNIKENKQVDNGSGKYIDDPTGAHRDKNEISKWFDSEKRTLPEKKASKDAKFYKDWEKSHTGKVRNNYKKVAGAAGMPAGGETAEDLFADE